MSDEYKEREAVIVAVCPDCGNEVERAGWTCGECADNDDDPDGDDEDE